jgi:hypothetical protein
MLIYKMNKLICMALLSVSIRYWDASQCILYVISRYDRYLMTERAEHEWTGRIEDE